MSLEPVIVRCPSCGAKNRVRREAYRPGARIVCGRCKTDLDVGEVPPVQGPVYLTDATVAREVDASSVPVLIDLWAPWCGPCRMIAPIIEQLSAELAGRVKVAKLNVDENPETASRFRAHSIPTLVLVSRGREVDRLIGLHPKLEIQRWLEEHLPHAR
jgi:thioredoxin 2